MGRFVSCFIAGDLWGHKLTAGFPGNIRAENIEEKILKGTCRIFGVR
jgi:hypothetical protein